MRPPRLILLILCFIFFPILLTTLSLLSSRPRHGSQANPSFHNQTGRLRAFFSFHTPSSLFPPSAIISLTDDNSTFFLSRPAAFGPPLPSKSLVGQLWIGSGFSDDSLPKGGVTWAEGELGCSDVPGWAESDEKLKEAASQGKEKPSASEKQTKNGDTVLEARGNGNSALGLSRRDDKAKSPPKDDGTDNHLHHPLPDSSFVDVPTEKGPERPSEKNKATGHADIQSLQESAEIAGKVVLLSRGGCGFLEKVKWVQRRGGVALIVGDNTRGGSLVTMYARGDTSNVTIPAVFTSHTTAHLLSSLIPPETPSSDAADDSSKDSLDDKGNKKTSRKGKAASTTKAAAKSTQTARAKAKDALSSPGTGILQSLFSLIGLWSDSSYAWASHEDSRRPPSSGNIDWLRANDWEDEDAPTDPKNRARMSAAKDGAGLNSDGSAKEPDFRLGEKDDFVIGEQDWRDPDLVNAPKNDPSQPTRTTRPAGSKDRDGGALNGGKAKPTPSPNRLKGGSITPGSGEYPEQNKRPSDKEVFGELADAPSRTNSQPGKAKQHNHWWSGPLGWALESSDEQHPPVTPEGKKDTPKDEKVVEPSVPTSTPVLKQDGKRPEREGLWVTLTPTSMSTSPFFDTLLVLVISPLITLTVVYALLLLRSRIRRRRWRAPKAVVDRLPVRTYHTMSSTSSSANSPETSTPRSSSPTAPLLSHARPRSPRPRSQTTGGILSTSNSRDAGGEQSSSSTEKSASGSTLWRRRYTGRQIECVVCLEEYVDGQSRVMSLPCGHEFHAECITPWLTTRRRTCPICKGDVVRSMGFAGLNRHRPDHHERAADDMQARIAETRNDSPSATDPMPVTGDDVDSDLERGGDSTTPLLGNSQDAQPQSGWRNLASLSLSALSGDSMWHQPNAARSDRNR
ncbi:hypothetical protein AJ80_06313 [Polytolypa hystricis UAMH7299]|uniref:RING-type E3 ubiquitin transferase n=1 Tax=Polytolypa hystricis (strain UAMH7299) TaxID=1447883 RepID=A0A2B7XNV0_POLH7|nr:hypothetical protein AJ80_06313 [Polytolypa hystricis UAMH7299]